MPFDQILLANKTQNWLENRNTNITMQLSHIYEAFSNSRQVAQIREEIEKVDQNFSIPNIYSTS